MNIDKKSIVNSDTAYDEPFSIATVVAVNSSGITLRFSGEQHSGQKAYRRIEACTAGVNDRVLVANIGGSAVVLGKIV